MTFYLLLWTSFYLLGVFYLFLKKKPPFMLIVLMLVIVAFCVACRVNVGADWAGYVEFYNTNQPEDGRELIEFEPLFRASRNVLYALGFSYQFFFFVFSFFSMYALVRVSKSFGVDNYFLVLIIYISLTFCSFQLNLFRIGIMCSCMWIALSYRKDSLWKTIVWMIIGSGFHYLGLLFLPLVFVVHVNIKTLWYVIIITASIIALFTNLGIKIVDSIPFLATLGRASDYLDPDSSFRKGNGVTVGLLFNIAFCIFLRYKYKKQYEADVNMRILLNMMLGAIIFSFCINGFGIIAQRGGQSMNVALCYSWSLFLTGLKKERRLIWLMLFTSYLVLFYIKNIGTKSETERMLIPYKIEVASLIR